MIDIETLRKLLRYEPDTGKHYWSERPSEYFQNAHDARSWNSRYANKEEQHGAAWMEFDTGLTYYYERGAGVHAEAPNETRLYGTKGGLRFQFPTWESHEVEYFYSEDDEPRKEVFTIDMSNAPDDGLALARHFLDCLDGTGKPLMTVQRAAKHMEILFKILE